MIVEPIAVRGLETWVNFASAADCIFISYARGAEIVGHIAYLRGRIAELEREEIGAGMSDRCVFVERQ